MPPVGVLGAVVEVVAVSGFGRRPRGHGEHMLHGGAWASVVGRGTACTWKECGGLPRVGAERCTTTRGEVSAGSRGGGPRGWLATCEVVSRS